MTKCKFCKKLITKRANVFCNMSCAASHNNKTRSVRPYAKIWNCIECGKSCNRNKDHCSRVCLNKSKLKEKTKLFLSGKLKRRQVIYEVLVSLNGNKCSKCGISEWLGKPIRFWVNHINGLSNDNKPSNLELICPNCDSQQPTFGAKNMGRGRKSLSQVGAAAAYLAHTQGVIGSSPVPATNSSQPS